MQEAKHWKKTIKDIRTNVGKQLDYNISRNNDLKTIHMGLVNAITNFTNVKNLAFANISNANMKFLVPTQQEQPNNKMSKPNSILKINEK